MNQKLLFSLILWQAVLCTAWAQSNNALHFDGVDDYVSRSSFTERRFTVEAWVKPDRVDIDQAIVSTLSTSLNAGFEMHIGGDGIPVVSMRDNSQWKEFKGTTAVTAGKWFHFVMTFDRTNCRVFINGVETVVGGTNWYMTSSGNMHIGCRASGGYHFKGTIDEVRVWDTDLSQEQINVGMHYEAEGTENSLKAYYKFDQGIPGVNNSGITVLTDGTANGVNGTLNNFSLAGVSSNWVAGYVKPVVIPIIHYVTPNGMGDGSSWGNASGNLQSMINSSGLNDQVWVAAGEYQPAAGQSFVMKEGVKIYGGFAGYETALEERNHQVNVTTLRGNGSNVIRNERNNLTKAAVLDGFTITGGHSGNNNLGGGIFNLFVSPTIVRCTFTGNSSRNNGGAIYNDYSSPFISYCKFISNSAYAGGAIFSSSSCSVISHCFFAGNETSSVGGALYIHDCPSLGITLIGCAFTGNKSIQGAALFNNYSTLVATNCTFAGNSVTKGFVGSSAEAIYNKNSSIKLYNSIVLGNDAGIFNEEATLEVQYSLVQGMAANAANHNLDGKAITASSVFVNPQVPGLSTGGNYSLKKNSPCHNTGDNGKYNTSIYGDVDLLGNPRIFEGTIDRGAYERQLKLTQTIDAPNVVKVYGDADFSPTISANSGLTVFTLHSENTDVATLVNGKIHIVGAGRASITVSQAGNDDYDPATTTFALTVDKAEIKGVTLLDKTITYDGMPHSLAIEGVLPDGVTVAYGGNGQSNVGEYKVTATVSGGRNHNDKTLTATLSIAKAEIIGVSLPDKTFTYDGSSHSLGVEGDLPDGATITYLGNGQTNVGTYIVTATITGGINYLDKTLTAQLVIDKAKVTGVALFDETCLYDGVAHSLAITGELPEGVTVTYSGNGQVEAGSHVVTANINGGDCYKDKILMATLTICQLPATAVIRYVKQGGTGDGSSWVKASGNLQAIIDASAAGDWVWVAAGEYQRVGTTLYFAMKEGVKIYGGFPATGIPAMNHRNPQANPTILKAKMSEAATDNCVILNRGGLTPSSLLDGFTIKGGNVMGCGGGMRNNNASPTIVNCSFIGNNAIVYGGGMYNSYNSKPVLLDCNFSGNSSQGGGSGMFNSESSPSLINCVFSNNKSASFGGAVANENFSTFSATNCVFVGNEAKVGGAMNNSSSTSNVIGCTFSANKSANDDAILNCSNSVLRMYNSILLGNSSGVASPQIAPVIEYCLVQGMSADDVRHNLDGNAISAASVFVDPQAPGLSTGGNYRLKPGSPCLNVGDYARNTTSKDIEGNNRIMGGVIDLGAYERQLMQQTIIAPDIVKTYGDADFTPLVTASSGLTGFVFSIDNQAVATIVDGVVHIVGAGTANITVTQAGNDDYAKASSVFVLTVDKANITGVTLDNVTLIYDGSPKVLEISGLLPVGTSVEYTGNMQTEVGVYVVTARITGGDNYNDLTLTATFSIVLATGINELVDRRCVNLYPNPCHNYVEIGEGAVKIRRVSFVNLAGQTVLVEEAPTGRIHVPSLKPGIYLVKVEDGIGKTSVLRLVKQ